jgi:thiamine biosynthesis lipoprotein
MELDFGGLGKEYAAERDGVRYCHVLDPRTGMPVRHWRSVTVVAPVAVAAGGYTTIAMLLEAGAAAHLEATGLPWLAVGPDGSIVSSPGAA